MKRFLALSLCCLSSFFSLAFAAPIASKPAPLASQSLLLDIVNVAQAKLVAVGEHGHILTSKIGRAHV